MTTTNQVLDPDEKEVLEALDSGDFVSAMKPEEPSYWASIAKKSESIRERKKGIQIRLNSKVLNQAKILAAHEGIPYQTKIQSLVHQWINDPKNQSILNSYT